jgi:hypothetical protein
MVPIALPFANRYSLSNVGQVFKDDDRASAFGIINQLFGNAVVYPAAKAGLFLRHLLQSALGRPRAFGLEGSFVRGASDAHRFDVCTRKGVSIGVGSNLHNAEINPKIALCGPAHMRLCWLIQKRSENQA